MADVPRSPQSPPPPPDPAGAGLDPERGSGGLALDPADLRCCRCGYRLVGLAHDRGCPECGEPIALSVSAHVARRGPEANLLHGAWPWFVGTACGALLLPFGFVAALLMSPCCMLVGLAGVAGSQIGWLVAALRLSGPLPDPLGRDSLSGVAAVCSVGLLFVGVCGLSELLRGGVAGIPGEVFSALLFVARGASLFLTARRARALVDAAALTDSRTSASVAVIAAGIELTCAAISLLLALLVTVAPGMANGAGFLVIFVVALGLLADVVALVALAVAARGVRFRPGIRSR